MARGILPKDGPADAAGTTAAAANGTNSSSSSSVPTTAPQSQPPRSGQPASQPYPVVPSAPLPPGWYQAIDPSYNHPYFYSPRTGERSWLRPAAPPRPSLPPGWTEAKDPASGVTYYCNAAAKQSVWERPLDSSPAFIAAAAFTGATPGYVFQLGSQGLGYYRDMGTVAGTSGTDVGDSTALSVARPVPLVGRSSGGSDAGLLSKKTRLEQIAEQQAKRHKSLGKRAGEEVDPMDPSAYSDTPRGSWGSGLERSQDRAD